MSDTDPRSEDLAGAAAHEDSAETPATTPAPDDTDTDEAATGRPDATEAADDHDPSHEDETTGEDDEDDEDSGDEPADSDGGSAGAQALDEGADDASSESAAGAADGSGDTDADDESRDRASDDEPDETAPPRKGVRRRSRRRKFLRRTAIGLVVVLVAGSGGGYWLYRDLMGGIEQKKVTTSQLGPDRPQKLNESLNILLLGSDTRAGDNSEYKDGTAGARSDTTILLHLSPNRDQAVAVSFPRDSMVEIPECEKEDGDTVAARFGMLNSAFAFAGPTCTWKMLESLTGIHIDHFVQIDFSGFKRMVDTLGGVEICVEKPVRDPRAELYLEAGKQTVKGDKALGYVRARYSLGNGSDLGRIERQQKFMAAVVDQALSSEVLADPAKTYDFLKAATESITTDDEFGLSDMRKLADGLRGISAGQVRFVTVPVEGYEPDPNRVQWTDELADPLFEAIRHDDKLPAEPEKPVQGGQAPPKPDEVEVTVVSAGAEKKAVERTVRQLERRGFSVADDVEEAPDAPQSRIVYAPSAEAHASVLARNVPHALLTKKADAPKGGVRLVIGEKGLELSPPAIKNIGKEAESGEKLCD